MVLAYIYKSIRYPKTITLSLPEYITGG